jgi:hypothetical protein
MKKWGGGGLGKISVIYRGRGLIDENSMLGMKKRGLI